MTDIDQRFLFLEIPAQISEEPELDEREKALVALLRALVARTGGSNDSIAETVTTLTEQQTTLDTQASDLATLQGQLSTLNSSVTTLATTVGDLLDSLPDYTVTNDVATRSLDCDDAAGAISATPTQSEVENIRDAVLVLADVTGTLINDLVAKDVFG